MLNNDCLIKILKIMKCKLFKIAFVVAIAMVAGINVFNAQKSESFSDVALANVEALAGGETGQQWGCAGNPTFIANEALRTAQCWNGGTHKKCKSENNVCCDPAQQTDCDGISLL